MPIASKIGLAILSPLFIFLLLAVAFDVGLMRTVTHPQTVKRLVSESGAYDSVVPNVLSQVSSIPTAYGNIPTSDPAIKRAVKAALPPQYIQQNTELAIDNIYDWLNGKIPQPNFQIDFSGAKVLFANNVADALQKRLAALPACSFSQSRQIALSGNYDAYNAACLPYGVSPVTVAEQLRAAIVSQQDFLKNTTISAAGIKGSNGRPLFSGQLASAPKVYRGLKQTPTILIILSGLSGIGIVFLSRSRLAGLRHIGINLLAIGVIMLVFSWLVNRAVSTNITPKIKVDNAILQQDMHGLITDVTQQVGQNYWFFGGLYAGLGIIAVAGSHLAMRRRAQTVTNNTPATQPAPPKPKVKT